MNVALIPAIDDKDKKVFINPAYIKRAQWDPVTSNLYRVWLEAAIPVSYLVEKQYIVAMIHVLREDGSIVHGVR